MTADRRGRRIRRNPRRERTEAQIGDLEVVARRSVRYRDSEFEEMDVDAVLARHPAQANSRRAGPQQRPWPKNRNAGRTWRSYSTPALTSSPPSTSSI